MSRRRLTTALLSFLVGASHAMAAPQPCESLTNLRLPDTAITMAVSTSGTFTPPDGPPLERLPAFCRVVGVIRPTSDSHIEFEVWMPVAGWNGKFQGIGNGGFAGAISHGRLAHAVSRGYAAASTDTGHKGGATDASWALGHPEKVIDFGHRAIHEMTVKAKAVVAAFYGGPPSRSYFASCSNGGRQALMEAQRYPDDYYQAVRARMGNVVDAFARLYLIPGLQHCTGGPGATYCGGLGVPFRDAEHDLSAALERWVEEGISPGELVATRPPDPSNLAEPAPPTPRRRICPYPRVASFRGTGSPDDPRAWTCGTDPEAAAYLPPGDDWAEKTLRQGASDGRASEEDR